MVAAGRDIIPLAGDLRGDREVRRVAGSGRHGSGAAAWIFPLASGPRSGVSHGMRRAPLLCLLAAFTACEHAEPAAPDAPNTPAIDASASSAPLVVVTINLRCLIDGWDTRLPLLADGLVAAGADVIGVQEVCAEPGGRDALEELIAALAARGVGGLAHTRTTTHRAWDTYDEGLAILSRHPIATVHIEPLPAGAIPRKVIAARVLAADGLRVFAVTHLDHQNAATRAEQAAAVADVLDELAAGTPTVLVGDLNEGPGGGVGAALTGAGLADAWMNLHPGDGGFTFPAHAPDIRIDYVWTRGDAVHPARIDRILTMPAGAIFASDHVGLSATLGT
jgi:endonuclease/exonuclease/phosphatase family metal-dependent hydrolase